MSSIKNSKTFMRPVGIVALGLSTLLIISGCGSDSDDPVVRSPKPTATVEPSERPSASPTPSAPSPEPSPSESPSEPAPDAPTPEPAPAPAPQPVPAPQPPGANASPAEDGQATSNGWKFLSHIASVENIGGVNFSSLDVTMSNDTGEHATATSFTVIGKDSAGKEVVFHGFIRDVPAGEVVTVPFMGEGEFTQLTAFEAVKTQDTATHD